jgi:RNA polymerase sigma-70 factor (ECF subfamily)
MTALYSARPQPPPEPTLEDAIPPELSDHEAIAASLDLPEAFASIFERHSRELHRFLSRRVGELADDLLGELFVTAFTGRASYRAVLADARPWLYGIATNLVRRHHRAEATRYRALSRLPLGGDDASEAEPAAVARLEAARVRPRLAAALAELKTADRDVLLLLAWAQLDQSEVAAALDIPVGTVRSRLHRARHQLRPILSDLADLPGVL